MITIALRRYLGRWHALRCTNGRETLDSYKTTGKAAALADALTMIPEGTEVVVFDSETGTTQICIATGTNVIFD